MKFLAITGTNLDEFFMIRVATTMRRFRAGVEDVAPDGYTTGQQLEAMRSCAHVMLEALATTWTTLRGAARAGADPAARTGSAGRREMHEYLNGYFSRDICPVLTPLAFDPGHPFPFISNLSKNFAVVVRHGGRIKFARVKVPDVLPRFVPLPESLGHGPHTFVFLEDVVRANIHELFPGTQVHGAHLFRIVRDADLAIEDEEDAEDLLEFVDRSLRQLRRGADLAAAGRSEHAGARARHPGGELRRQRRRRGALHRASRLRRLARSSPASIAPTSRTRRSRPAACGAPTRIRRSSSI